MTATQKCLVLLPVYNGERFLRATLESVFAQGEDFHLLAADDASSDSSYSILCEFAARAPKKMTLVLNSRNIGAGETLRKMARMHFDSEYLAQIGQDDFWEPGYLSSQMECLRHTGRVAAFSHIDVIDIHGKTTWHGAFRHHELHGMPRHVLFSRLLNANFLCAPASVVRLSALKDRTDLQRYFGVRNDLIHDYELWLHLSTLGSFEYCKSARAKYRWHGANLSAVTDGSAQGRFERLAMLRRVLFSPEFALYWEEVRHDQNAFQHILRTLAYVLRETEADRALFIELLELLVCQNASDDDMALIALAAAYHGNGIHVKAARLDSKLPLMQTHGQPPRDDTASFHNCGASNYYDSDLSSYSLIARSDGSIPRSDGNSLAAGRRIKETILNTLSRIGIRNALATTARLRGDAQRLVFARRLKKR